MSNTSETQYPTISTQERSETQLYTRSPAENSKKALGFTWAPVDVAYPEKVVFFYDFTVLVAAVLPNLQENTCSRK